VLIVIRKRFGRSSDVRALCAVDAVAESLVVAALLGELIVVLGNVFALVYLHHSFRWADEVATFGN
jgi:TRAP-type C4-dicarboxylate transport system permease small subunit